GDWKLSFHITALDFKLDGKRIENNNPSLQEASFSIAMNKDGELLNIPENQSVESTQGNLFSFQNPLLLLPWMLLPRKPIGIGETWRNEFATALPDESSPHLDINLKGSGVVKEVKDNQADIELTFVSELNMRSSNRQ